MPIPSRPPIHSLSVWSDQHGGHSPNILGLFVMSNVRTIWKLECQSNALLNALFHKHIRQGTMTDSN